MVTRHGLTVPAFGGAGRCQRETDEQARRWGRTWLARRGIRTGAPSPLCESRTSPRFFAAEPQRSQRSEEILGLLWVAIAVPRSSSWASTRPSQKIQVFTASAVRVHGERRPCSRRAPSVFTASAVHQPTGPEHAAHGRSLLVFTVSAVRVRGERRRVRGERQRDAHSRFRAFLLRSKQTQDLLSSDLCDLCGSAVKIPRAPLRLHAP